MKNAFIRTLRLTDDAVIAPEHSHLFAAIGSAMNADTENVQVPLKDLWEKLDKGVQMKFEVKRLEPLFRDEEEFEEFW